MNQKQYYTSRQVQFAAQSQAQKGQSQSQNRKDLNITAPILSFSGTNLHQNVKNIVIDSHQETLRGSAQQQPHARTNTQISLHGHPLVSQKAIQAKNGFKGGKQGQTAANINYNYRPQQTQNNSQVNSSFQNKRTIMSGIVRRQPLPQQIKSHDTTIEIEPKDQQLYATQNASGGSLVRGEVNKSGVLAQQNGITFYPQTKGGFQQHNANYAGPQGQTHRQASTSHGKRMGNNKPINLNQSQGGTLSNKWARLMHGQSPDSQQEGQLQSAINLAFSGSQSPSGQNQRFYQNRPGTQGTDGMSPNNLGPGGTRQQDMAIRVRKYRYGQYPHTGNQPSSQINQTRNKTQSQRGLNNGIQELVRNQTGSSTRPRMNGYTQNKAQRAGNNDNATLENRASGNPHFQGRNGMVIYGSKESDAFNQNQKMQNNFFFQPASPRDSTENVGQTHPQQQQRGDAISPIVGTSVTGQSSGYSQQRNVRTAAGGPRQRNLKTQNTQGLYHQLQIQTSNNGNLTMVPNQINFGNQHPQTVQNISQPVGKSFDFNRYRKDGSSQPHVAATSIIPATNHNNGFSSPQSHPEQAFFKPKINTGDRTQIVETTRTTTNTRLNKTQPDMGTLSPKSGDNNKTMSNKGQQLWTTKKKEEVKAKPEKETATPPQEDIVFSDKHSLNDYIIGKQIGQGAYAIVRIGMHKKLNKKLALKIYEKEKIKDIQRKKSVRREIRLMKRISHPNIATLYEAIETEDQVILVLEYVPGGSTHGFLKSKPHRRMQEDEARAIYVQLINALHYLHSRCIAHRDIKLENVMLDERRNVKLIDFGFSTCIPNDQRIKMFCGTPSYMAPEIVKKTEYCGPPTDIYASGVLLFAFFCGQFPFRGQNDKDLYSKIQAGDLTIPDHVPSGPRRIISRCMQNKADDRPTSQELWADPWLQNFGPTNDQSLISQSSRQSYSTRGGSNYNQNTSARYIKANSGPQSQPSNQRTSRGKTAAETAFSGNSSAVKSSGQTINNNINIINNITQITYHTAEGDKNKQAAANNKNQSKANLNSSNANLELTEADKKTMKDMAQMGLSQEEIQLQMKKSAKI